jgi:uncharacterized protein
MGTTSRRCATSRRHDRSRGLALTHARAGAPFVFGLLPHTGNEVGGGLYSPGADNAPSRVGPLIYPNAEGRLAQAVADKGGQVLQAVHQIGPHGFRAIVVDTEGNRIALHAPADSA